MQVRIAETQKTKMYNRQLLALAGTMQAAEYVAGLTIKGFTYDSEKEQFSVDLLKELYSYNSMLDINGVLKKTSFEEIQKKMAYGLSWRGGSCDYDAEEYPEVRELVFWDIVQRAFEFPANECLEFLQTDGQCVFGGNDWIMWDYCFILLKKNMGIVLLCGAGPY